ncbi:GcrA cell cycle regulator [bacterium]|nr:GcrA cell cycle regulator [bacterium]
MGWTDDRVATLKKLWLEGLSASQIATELGEGVTRNAVIGKVHRLKLSGRAKPATSTARPRTAARPSRRTSSGGGGSHSTTGATMRRRTTTTTSVVGATVMKHEVTEEVEVKVNSANEIFIPEGERLTLLQLSEKTCKWPIGDPLLPDFHFCGRDSNDDAPYCEFHSKKAYHQMDRRKR